MYGNGFYFGEPNRGSGEYKYSVFLNIRNPYFITKNSHTSVVANFFNREISGSFSDKLNSKDITDIKNSDGIIDNTEYNEYVVKNSNQIKFTLDDKTHSINENATDKQNILSEEDKRKAEEIKKHCKGE